MGQGCSCCAGVLVNKSRRRHTGHKRFDFAPKRSWKYKDATLLNEFHEMEMSHDMNSDTEQLIDDNGAAATPSGMAVANSNHHQQQQADISSDEEEINTGNYRPSGRLVFTEGGDSDSGEEDLMATPLTKSGYSQLQLEEEESRDRSQSTGSEQIGRFEVWDVVDESRDPSSPTSPEESQPQLHQFSLTGSHHQEESGKVHLRHKDSLLAQEQPGETSQLMADPQT